MANIPKTSVALLRAIAEDSNSARWNDFYDRYQPVMEAYLKAAYPSVEQEDVIQEAMIVFMNKVKTYEYDPDNKGLFRNYLVGILKFKAIEALKHRKGEAEKRDAYKEDPTTKVILRRRLTLIVRRRHRNLRSGVRRSERWRFASS